MIKTIVFENEDEFLKYIKKRKNEIKEMFFSVKTEYAEIEEEGKIYVVEIKKLIVSTYTNDSVIYFLKESPAGDENELKKMNEIIEKIKKEIESLKIKAFEGECFVESG